MNDGPQKLVSVVICNYNYDQYLSEAIKSVLGQSYENLQVIVVDDGSADGSRDILHAIEDSRLQVICQENAGQASAFNTGFRQCCGEFVGFLDSDDFWYQYKLAVSIPVFEQGNISVVQHNMDIVDAYSEKQGGVHPGIGVGRKSLKDSYFKENHTGFFCPTSGMVCRKADLDRVFPINRDWKICADVAFTRPLPMFGDIVTLGEVLGGYRVHGENNWMNSEGQKKWIENQQSYVDYTNEWLEHLGYEERIVFENSNLYLHYWKMSGLPLPFRMRIRDFFSRFFES